MTLSPFCMDVFSACRILPFFGGLSVQKFRARYISRAFAIQETF